MPSSVTSSLSSESLSALLFALGLTEPSTDETENTKGTVDPIPGISRFVAHDTLHLQRPTAPFSRFLDANHRSNDDEAQIFGRDFFGDFDTCSDLEDDRDSDFDFETLPSRPGSSSLDGFHYVDSPTSTIQQHDIITSPPSSPNSYQSSNPLDSLCVKAAHNASIIMLRTPRDISFVELKQRLYNKFVNQENIFLSPSFSVLLALPPASSPTPRPSQLSIAYCTEMSFIDREIEWRRIAARNDGSKITLRILDTPT